jgi:hypothetical protein
VNEKAHHYMSQYLTDHWAAAGGGIALARRLRDENCTTPWAEALARLAEQIAADDATLQAVRRAVCARGGAVRRVLAVATERVSRLKLNGKVLGYSPLSRVIEAEALISGIYAKRQLWLALSLAPPAQFEEGQFTSLTSRADAQLELMHDFHQWAVKGAMVDAH